MIIKASATLREKYPEAIGCEVGLLLVLLMPRQLIRWIKYGEGARQRVLTINLLSSLGLFQLAKIETENCESANINIGKARLDGAKRLTGRTGEVINWAPCLSHLEIENNDDII